MTYPLPLTLTPATTKTTHSWRQHARHGVDNIDTALESLKLHVSRRGNPQIVYHDPDDHRRDITGLDVAKQRTTQAAIDLEHALVGAGRLGVPILVSAIRELWWAENHLNAKHVERESATGRLHAARVRAEQAAQLSHANA